MTVQLYEPTHAALEYLCFNLRPGDAEEVFGLLNHDAPFRLAWETYHGILNHGRGRVAYVNGRPAAVAAFIEMHSGVWQVWMFGTEDFKKGAFPLLKWFRHEANDILGVCRGHRLQCDSRADYAEAHKMIEGMGGVRESVMRRYGKDGSDYVRFVWLNGENDSVLRRGHTRQKAEV